MALNIPPKKTTSSTPAQSSGSGGGAVSMTVNYLTKISQFFPKGASKVEKIEELLANAFNATDYQECISKFDDPKLYINGLDDVGPHLLVVFYSVSISIPVRY